MQKSRSITDYFTRRRQTRVPQDSHDEVGDIIIVAQRPLSEQRPGKREWPYSPPHKKLRPHRSTISQVSPIRVAALAESSPVALENGLNTTPKKSPRPRRYQDASASGSPRMTAPARVSPQAMSKPSVSTSTAFSGCLTVSTSQDGSMGAPKSHLSTASALRISRNGVQIVRSSDDEEEDAEVDLACEEEMGNSGGEEQTLMVSEEMKRQGVREGCNNEDGAVQKDVESDSESSLSSLEDLDDLFAKNKPIVVSSPVTAPVSQKKEDDGRSFRSSRSTRSAGNQTLPTTSNYTISLTSLLARHKKDLATQADVAQAKERMSVSVRDASTVAVTAEESHSMGPRLDQDLLVAVLKDGDEDVEAQRVLQAAQRTEALDYDITWCFFEFEQYKQTPRRPFPCGDLPSASWANLLKG